jgi:phytoene dehydrogenase-like protein
MKTDYGTIVIGSGAGGLAAAVALAQAGQKVLVCEQHEVPGGWMHSFTLEGYRFNTGVHYIGELGPGGRLRRIYEGLGIANDLTFMELNPQGYDHILIGTERFDIPKGKEAYIERLKLRFPNERGGIEGLFNTTEAVFWSLQRIIDEEYSDLWRRPKALPWFARSGGALVDHFVKDRTLRAFLKGQSGAHGMAPAKVSAALHSAIVHHYMEGAYHPLGGGSAIARSYLRALRRAGGELRLQTPVRRIVLKEKRAVGVELASGELLTASTIVSNADPHGTFYKLVGREKLSWRLRRKLGRVGYSTSCVSLYLVLGCDLRDLGLDSGNYWLHSHDDIDAIFARAATPGAIESDPELLFATATSLKDPTKSRSDLHQLEIFAFTDIEPFVPWQHQPSGQRDADYQRLKAGISQRILKVADRFFPGLRQSVVLQELGTPLTNQHYVHAHQGNMYGIDKGIWQAGPLGFRAETEFQNLYLCGASTMAHGVAYATNSGLTAAGKVLGCDPQSFIQRKRAELSICQCEDTSTWPLQYRHQVQDETRAETVA